MKLNDPAPVRDAAWTRMPPRWPRRCATTRRETWPPSRAYESTLGERGFVVPYSSELNPPLGARVTSAGSRMWWLRRNPQRAIAVSGADPEASALAAAPVKRRCAVRLGPGRPRHTMAVAVAGPDALRSARKGAKVARCSRKWPSGEALYFSLIAMPVPRGYARGGSVHGPLHLGLPLQSWAPAAHAAVHGRARR